MRSPSLVLALLLSSSCGRTGLGHDDPTKTKPVPDLGEAPCAPEGCGVGLALGLSHSCALVDGAAWCWGGNGEAQLGFPADTVTKHEPRAVPTSMRFTQLVAGEYHSCGLTSRGEVWCWGGGRHGQLGDGVLHHPADFHSETPRRIEGLPWTVRLEVGEVKTCAFTDDGAQWCWGGWTGAQPVKSVAPPSFDAYRFMTGCVVESGQVRCWGANNTGQLGVPAPTDESKTLVKVPGLPADVVEVVTPMLGTCALTSAGKVWCWGDWAEGDRLSPREVSGLSDVTTLRFGFTAVCALTRSGRVGCMNTGGAMATAFFSFTDIEDFNAGAWQACVLRRNREVWCQTAEAHGTVMTEAIRVATLPATN